MDEDLKVICRGEWDQSLTQGFLPVIIIENGIHRLSEDEWCQAIFNFKSTGRSKSPGIKGMVDLIFIIRRRERQSYFYLFIYVIQLDQIKQ